MFEDVPDAALTRIKSRFRDYTVSAGEELHMLYDGTTYLYIIKSGYMTLRYPSRLLPGVNTYFLAWRGPGHVIGEVGFLAQRERDPIIVATQNCVLWEIPTEEFIKEADQCAILYKNLARVVNQKVMDHAQRMEVVQMPGAAKRVARTLFILARERGFRPGTPNYINGQITVEDLAGYIGFGDASVTNAINELSKADIIGRPNVDREWVFQIKDMKKLEEFALPDSRGPAKKRKR